MTNRILAPATVWVLGAALACGTLASAQTVIIDLDRPPRQNERLRDPDLGVFPPVDLNGGINRPIEGSIFVYGTSFRMRQDEVFKRGEIVLGILSGDTVPKGIRMGRPPYETVPGTPSYDFAEREQIEGSVLDIVQTADGDLFAASIFLSVIDLVPGDVWFIENKYFLIGDARARRWHRVEAEFARPSGDWATDLVNPGNWEHVAQSSALITRCVQPLVRAEIVAGFRDGGSDAGYTLGELDASVYLDELAGFTADDRLVVTYQIDYTAAFTLAIWPGAELEITGESEIVVDYVRGDDDIWRTGDCAVSVADVAPLPAIPRSRRLSVSDEGVLRIDSRELTNRDDARFEPGTVSAVAGPRP